MSDDNVLTIERFEEAEREVGHRGDAKRRRHVRPATVPRDQRR